MKYLLLLIMVSISFTSIAKDISHMSRKEKAAYRASQHPKGSCIGTNRYSTGRYDRVNYPIEKYQRVYPRDTYKRKYRRD